MPLPYPNFDVGLTAAPAAYHVLYMCTPAHNMSTTSLFSNGDNIGIAGVASGRVMGPDRNVTAAFTVLVGGMPGTKLTSVAINNGTNCPGMRGVPSQVKVLLLAP